MGSAVDIANLDDENWNRLQEIVERFEKDCSLSYPRSFAAYLPAATEPLHACVLEELVRTDLELRWRRRRGVLIEHYLQRYPELSTTGCLPTLLRDEYGIRHRMGDKPDLTEYESRFPQFFAQLLDLATTVEAPDSRRTQFAPSAAAIAASSILDEPDSDPTDPPVTDGAADGSVVGGKYRLLRKIGAGGFGEVWEAEGAGGVPIAIKRILASVSARAIEREKESLDLICSGKLRHPFLLQVFGWWIEDEKLHIAMELADRSLQDEIRAARKRGRHGLPTNELRQILLDAASALDFLNFENNILHRDVKPANLLLMGKRLKLCDFGLSRMSEHLALAAGRTMGAGTPLFMAPEIIQGYQSPFSDQYSLAVSYYLLRTGKPVFRGRANEVRKLHVSTVPALESEQLNSGEREVLRRALSKTPSDRFEHSARFVEALIDTWTERDVAPPVMPPQDHRHDQPNDRPAPELPGVGTTEIPPLQEAPPTFGTVGEDGRVAIHASSHRQAIPSGEDATVGWAESPKPETADTLIRDSVAHRVVSDPATDDSGQATPAPQPPAPAPPRQRSHSPAQTDAIASGKRHWERLKHHASTHPLPHSAQREPEDSLSSERFDSRNGVVKFVVFFLFALLVGAAVAGIASLAP